MHHAQQVQEYSTIMTSMTTRNNGAKLIVKHFLRILGILGVVSNQLCLLHGRVGDSTDVVDS